MNPKRWKQLKKIGPKPPRVIKSMPPSRTPITCKAARGATSGGNRKHTKAWHAAQYRQASKAKASYRGRMKIYRLLDRMVRPNRSGTFMKRTVAAVKGALGG